MTLRMRRFLTLVFSGTVLFLACAQQVRAEAFYAYSMAQARARAMQGGHAEATVDTLGGLNVFVGMVYDHTSSDLILIGQRVPDQPAVTLDDLVVALRALLVHKSNPLVSIDPTADTPQTGLQAVHFEGGIAGTQYGADLLAADILLKKIGLNLAPSGVPQVQPYVLLAAAQRAQHLADDGLTTGSRFWFKLSKDSALVERDGVFAIRTLQLIVDSELVQAQLHGQPAAVGFRDASGDAFTAAMSSSIDALCAQHPILARLRLLNSLVALARGMGALAPSEALRYWLEAYPVRPVETPTHYTFHVQREPYRDRQGRASFVEVVGGIELQATILSLKAGDVTALRRAVLASRPDPQALTCSVGQCVRP